LSGVQAVSISQDLADMVGSMMDALDMVIWVIVVAAGLMAVTVLYNLTNINITERIREIATVKVLGFYDHETAAYVFREVNMLSAGGSIVGLFMGKALHAFVIMQIQVENMYFPIKIAPLSYVISVVLTMVFSILITRFMRPRLKKIKMAESLKSIE
jgi:putative ABC transport system permease protein